MVVHYGRFLDMTVENAIELGKCIVPNTLVVRVQFPYRQYSSFNQFFPWLPSFLWKPTSLALFSLSFYHFRNRLQKQQPGGNMKYSYTHYLEASTNILRGVCFLLKAMSRHAQTHTPHIYIYLTT